MQTTQSGSEPGVAPEAQEYHFPRCPASWHYVAPARSLESGPIGFQLDGDGDYVAYRTESGRIVVLSGRCSHLGSPLARGKVVGERLRCGLHGWEYDPEGHCARIPASAHVPSWARQCSYPVHEIAGHIFFFNRASASFPFPQFEGTAWSSLQAAQPLEFLIEAPWHAVTSNGFDLQHFHCSHDRELLDEPKVDSPHPFARRIVARFRVAGDSWRDSLTRRFSGPEVTMDVTDWAGNIVFVFARFRRTTTFGLMFAQPVAPNRTLSRVIIFVPRSANMIGRALFDTTDARVRRHFIRHFLQPDAERIDGLQYHRRRWIAADRILRDYLEWLEQLHQENP